MAETASLINRIKAPMSKVFRRLLIKRRSASTGLFESTWQDLTRFVKRWGSFSVSADTPRFGDLRFDNASIQVINIDGTFNPNDNADSFWSGYADMQRSLVRIEAGFAHQTQSAGGIWTNTEFPTTTTIFQGILSGDIFMSSRSEITLPLRPLTQIFRDYLARDMRGYTTTGMTAGAWFTRMRDHTDGSGNLVFRPFIGDGTTTAWTIASGTIDYGIGTTATGNDIGLNTSTSNDIYDLDCWGVTERIAQAENYIAFVNREGNFFFQKKTATASVQYEFYGLGSSPTTNRVYGHTIKSINQYGKRHSAYYSRVAVKYSRNDTSTSFVNTQTTFLIDGSNTAWNLGNRTYSIENFFLHNSTNAAAIASAVLTDVISQSEEIEFTTTFIPHLNLFDRVSISYDATDFVSGRSLWDLNDWAADDTSTSQDLIWDSSRGDSIILSAVEFKLLSISMDLDNLETRFIAKKL